MVVDFFGSVLSRIERILRHDEDDAHLGGGGQHLALLRFLPRRPILMILRMVAGASGVLQAVSPHSTSTSPMASAALSA